MFKCYNLFEYIYLKFEVCFYKDQSERLKSCRGELRVKSEAKLHFFGAMVDFT